MRIALSKWVALAGMVGGLAGCGNSPTAPVPTNGSITATVDGSSFSAVTVAATYTGGIMGLGGTDSQGRTLGIGGQIPGPGTYTIGPTSPANFALTIGSASWQAAITLGSGTLTVTSISAAGAKGTFQFTAGPVPGTTASGNKVVTQGAFDVKF
jgi:hypothetical protein